MVSFKLAALVATLSAFVITVNANSADGHRNLRSEASDTRSIPASPTPATQDAITPDIHFFSTST